MLLENTVLLKLSTVEFLSLPVLGELKELAWGLPPLPSLSDTGLSGAASALSGVFSAANPQELEVAFLQGSLLLGLDRTHLTARTHLMKPLKSEHFRS